MKISTKRTDAKQTQSLKVVANQATINPMSIQNNILGHDIISFSGNKTSLNPIVAKFLKFNFIAGPINDKKILSPNLAKKVNDVYNSAEEARQIFSAYRQELSLNANPYDGCITPLSQSNSHPTLFYKREDLTSIKAYKVRGAFYQMKKVITQNPEEEHHFVAASTGNHALGVLKSAEILNASKVSICVPETVSAFKREKLEKKVLELSESGVIAKLLIQGKTFDEANMFAQKLAQSDEFCHYIDPYNNHNAAAGQGTIALELLSQLNNLSNVGNLDKLTVLVPIGGGGLISGISCVLSKGLKKYTKFKNTDLEIIGVKLADLNSQYGDAIKVAKIGSNNADYLENLVSQQLEITDIDMKKGMEYVAKDLGAKVEGASAGTLAPILNGVLKPNKKHAIVCVLSGGNV